MSIKLFNTKNPRINGVVLMCTGIIGGGIYINHLLAQAEKHVSEITVYSKLIALFDIMTVLGLFMTIFGSKMSSMLQIDNNNLTLSNVIFILILAAIGISGYVGVLYLLEGVGYK